jgi:ABC-type nitrate/sulfonate/bicarbonate transport system substrate-binding protein
MQFTPRSRTARLVAAGTAAAAVALSLTSCASGQASAKAVPASKTLDIRVGSIVPVPGVWPMEAAIDEGFFRKLHLKVTVVKVQRDSDCLRALAGGSLDACAAAPDSLIRVADSGAKVRLVAGLTQHSPEMLVGAKNVHSIADLKGKQVAVASPTEGSTLALLSLLATRGIKPSDVRMISVGGSSARLAALNSGQAAATMLAAPGSLYSVAKGYPRLGIAGQDPSTDYGEDVSAPQHLTGAKREALQRLVTGVVEGSDWLNDRANKAKVIQEAQRGDMKIEDGFGARTYALYLGGTKQIIATHGRPSLATVNAVMNMMKDFTSYTPRHGASYYVDNSYLTATHTK